ncbi:MAG: hypothetical protein BWX50_01512 [Euryarchaeota archaeon ADurb.Bin009]|nr:MAG: hypothetical protein BWX50_01512 [Euryarchaeota archaeon ADurb.Bin009]
MSFCAGEVRIPPSRKVYQPAGFRSVYKTQAAEPCRSPSSPGVPRARRASLSSMSGSSSRHSRTTPSLSCMREGISGRLKSGKRYGAGCSPRWRTVTGCSGRPRSTSCWSRPSSSGSSNWSASGTRRRHSPGSMPPASPPPSASSITPPTPTCTGSATTSGCSTPVSAPPIWKTSEMRRSRNSSSSSSPISWRQSSSDGRSREYFHHCPQPPLAAL